MRRALIPVLISMAPLAGCATGRQGLVQMLRVPAPTIQVQHSPPRDPNALTPRERQMFDDRDEATRAPERPAQKSPEPGTLPPGRVASSAVSHQELRWRQDYESAQRRSIETIRLGSGDRRIFVTSSLHGNEADTVRVLEAALRSVSSSSADMTDRALLAVRTPNPDGAADRTLTNSRGVDLNRNWPSPRFPAGAEKITGDAPASEPETRALIQILADFRPTRVIHIVSGASSRGAVLASCDVKGIPGFDVVRTDELKAATIEDFSVTRLHAEVVTLVLPSARDASGDSESVRQLVALMTDQVPSSQGSTSVSSSSTVDLKGPARLKGDVNGVASAGEKAQPDGAKGYVQLLPEPPVIKAIKTNGGLGDRYFELPPPK